MLTSWLLAAAAFQAAPCNLEGAPAGFEREHGVECGWVSVKRDATGSKRIRLWTARVRAATAQKRADPILYINGGPGIATVDAVLPSLPASATMKAWRQDRDIIIFDQRGSGRSEEALCPELAKTLNGISSKGLDPVAEEESKRAAIAACGAKLRSEGIDIGAYSTRRTVADIEELRRAFGVGKWNLFSVSYGTLVAMDAMRTDPGSIRSVILSSPFPPNSAAWAEQVSTTAAGYEAIDRACARQPECRQRFGDVAAKLSEVLARLEREPIKDGAAVITGRRFAEALWPIAVRSSTVRYVPLVIDRAYAGDTDVVRKMVAKFAGGESFGGLSAGQGLAISCHESGRTTEWYARARSLYPNLATSEPDYSWDRLCAVYRPDHADPAFFAPVASEIPTIIYAGSLDPAVPVIDAYQALRFLSSATLVEVKDAAHAPSGIDECTRGIMMAFLDKPEVGPDTTCLAKRGFTPFAADGLDELLKPE